MKEKFFSLTKDQQNKIEVLSWFISDEGKDRATGRTTLMAIAFIKKAYDNQCMPVRFFDHHQNNGNEESLAMMRMTIEQNIPNHLRKYFRVGHSTIIFK